MSTNADDVEDSVEIAVIDEAADDDSVAPLQYDIASYGADYDVEGLVTKMGRGDISIPPFQRNYIWKQHEASRFIESLLLGLPVPGVFFAREADTNRLLVIDGQQRLKTLEFFYKGFFNPKQGDTKRHIFKLIKVQPRFEGQTYASLSDKDRRKLNESLIHATVVKQESPRDDDTSIYHIFDRLNSEGRRLTPQEIRTAIYHGDFIDLLKELNEYTSWREIFGKRSSRLKDHEMILRFLALYFNSGAYEKPMNEFLNKFCHEHCKPKKDSQATHIDFLGDCRRKFVEAIDTVRTCIGQTAFRPLSTINAAVFDSVMVGLARRLDKGPLQSNEGVKQAYNQLLGNDEYSRLISQSTSDELNVKKRIELAERSFAGI